MFQNHPLNLNFPSVIVIIRIVFVEIVEDADIDIIKDNNNTEQQKNENVYEKIRTLKKKKREENINSLGDFLGKNKKGKKRMDNDESYFASLFLQHTTSLPILIPFSHLSELE